MGYLSNKVFVGYIFVAIICQLGTSMAQTPLPSAQEIEWRLSELSGKNTVAYLNELSVKFRLTNSQQALKYAEEARVYAIKIEDYHGLAQANINIGVIRRNLGQPTKALPLFTEARALAAQYDFPTIEADALHKIGVTYLLLKDFESALEFGKKEVALWNQLDNQRGLAAALNFLGLTHLNRNEFEEAETKLDSALKLGEALNDTSLMYKPLVNLADLFITQEKPEAAIPLIERSLTMSKKSGNGYGIAINLYKLAEAHQYTNTTQALQLVKQALEEAQNLGYLSLERNCYSLLAELYKKEGKYDTAFYYQEARIVTEDTVLNSMLEQQARQMENNFALEQRLTTLELSQKSKAYNRLTYILLVLSIGFVMAISWLISSNYRGQRSTKQLIVSKNQEIDKQAQEIEQKRQQLKEQTIMLVEQKENLEAKSQKINESLEYAKQVQDSLLPANPSFLNIFQDYFVVNLPQDVISGDFCWYTHQGDTVNIVIADCSGHGVSGAFNTVIINSLVAQVINETNYRTPADLLEELHKRIIKLIPADQYINFNIGIKIGIIRINVNSLRMVFAGAKIPLYYITNGELKILKPDKVFVGGSHYPDISNRFHNRMISLKKGDKLMIFTDGYQDQFGEKGKFMVKNLRMLLSDMANEPLSKQNQSLMAKLKDWQGGEPQTDDILIFGLQV